MVYPMAQAKPYDTDSNYRTPLRSYVLEGLCVAWVLICAAALGCMVAERVNGKLGTSCFCPVEKAVQ
jgi:hypothetical protein